MNSSIRIIGRAVAICGGVDCPIFICVYHRKKVIINFDIYHHLQIMRFLCRDKGNLKSKHKTFSLLPQPLFPFQQTGLDVMFENVKQHHAGKSLKQTKDHISQMGVQTDISLEDKQIRHFQKIFDDAFHKLNVNTQVQGSKFPVPG